MKNNNLTDAGKYFNINGVIIKKNSILMVNSTNNLTHPYIIFSSGDKVVITSDFANSLIDNLINTEE